MINLKKGFFVFAIIAILAIGSGLLISNKNKRISQYTGLKPRACIVKENRGDTVPVDIAEDVALTHAVNNNKPYDWAPVGYYPVYGSSGLVNYYIFIFRKSEFTKFTSLSDLEQNAGNYADESSSNDNKYQFNDVATVWTGSSDRKKLIVRHYRGIPEIIAEKMKIKKYVEAKYADKTIGNIIADSEAGRMYFEIIIKSKNKATGDVIDVNNSISSKNDLIDNQKRLDDREAKRRASYDQKKCDQLRQMTSEAEEDIKNQWKKYYQ